jgi:hypothetical protein
MRTAEAVSQQSGGPRVVSSAPQLAEITAFRNGTLQGGYFIIAARARAGLRPHVGLR